MKREIVLIILGLFFVVCGVFALAKQSSSSLPLKDASVFRQTFADILSSGLPKWMEIDSAKISSEVAAGGYENGKWVLDSRYVLYLPTSGKLGDGGNTVFYAHNRDKLFGNLKKVSIGDTVKLGDSNGKTYIYKVYSLEYIKPSQIEKIDTNKKNTITLFTCDGWFDEKRLVVKAEII
ncbi:MAG: hypothetical protein A2687_00510 [Candidatus Levybacteria bacterium RIFCSPHIGHO2_01_FULL_38_26]|nr:MAG: hypothetical protein A2687_00510 [Candidatus Levybacteria bacterium RIFCSPHIGHO2_01_FULL_38_26]